MSKKNQTQEQESVELIETPTMIERWPQNKRSTISVRPYIDPNVPNQGLEKYDLALYDGALQEEQLTCLEINGVKRYLTGLNEYAPELLDLEPEAREAKIREIRVTVSELEKMLASNVVDPGDKEFWNKVKLCRPDNDAFWSQITIRVGNQPLFLEPHKDAYDLIKLKAIEAGGFSLVAPSLEKAKTSIKPYKFYLDKEENTAASKTELKKLRNQAGSILEDLFNTNQNKLTYVAKVLDAHSVQYKKTTPSDVLYFNMDKYIDGELGEKNKRLAAKRFIEVSNNDMGTLKLRALVKDMTFYKELAVKADGFIYHMKTGSLMGKTPTDVVEYLKNPLNEEILNTLMREFDKYFNQ